MGIFGKQCSLEMIGSNPREKQGWRPRSGNARSCLYYLVSSEEEEDGSLRIERRIRQHSCSFHVQNLFLARLRLGFSGGVGFKRAGTKLIFWQWHQRRWLLLCLKWSMFEVLWRQWSGRASSLLPRSRDDYQLLSACISETTVSVTCE